MLRGRIAVDLLMTRRLFNLLELPTMWEVPVDLFSSALKGKVDVISHDIYRVSRLSQANTPQLLLEGIIRIGYRKTIQFYLL